MGKKRWTEPALAELLSDRYSGRDWAFLRSVPNGTGQAKSRTCDALAMSLWPSKGLHLHGFEIKCDRSDWLREIQDVSKSEAFACFCHYWWIVAPKGVVKLEELPPLWGLIEPAVTSLRVRKPAGIRENVQSPSCAFIAGLLRAALKVSPGEAELNAAREEGIQAGERSVQFTIDQEHRRANQDYESLKKAVTEFEQASGVTIEKWTAGRIGEAVKLVLNVNLGWMQHKLVQVRRQLEKVSEDTDNAIGLIEQAQKIEGEAAK